SRKRRGRGPAGRATATRRGSGSRGTDRVPRGRAPSGYSGGRSCARPGPRRARRLRPRTTPQTGRGEWRKPAPRRPQRNYLDPKSSGPPLVADPRVRVIRFLRNRLAPRRTSRNATPNRGVISFGYGTSRNPRWTRNVPSAEGAPSATRPPSVVN